MQGTRVRFTIRSLMIAVAAVALLMSLPTGLALLVGVASFVGLAFVGASWVEHRGLRRLAAVGFWVPAILVDILYAAVCLAPISILSGALVIGWFVLFAPVIGRFGVAWVVLATRETATPRRSREMAWAGVVVLTVLPFLTVLTFWPLRLGFLVARPTLERLADQAAAGRLVTFPNQAGPFEVLRASVDPVSGQVGLMIEPNPSRPTGFVRTRSEELPGSRRPIIGTELSVELGWGWSYREDD